MRGCEGCRVAPLDALGLCRPRASRVGSLLGALRLLACASKALRDALACVLRTWARRPAQAVDAAGNLNLGALTARRMEADPEEEAAREAQETARGAPVCNS